MIFDLIHLFLLTFAYADKKEGLIPVAFIFWLFIFNINFPENHVVITIIALSVSYITFVIEYIILMLHHICGVCFFAKSDFHSFVYIIMIHFRLLLVFLYLTRCSTCGLCRFCPVPRRLLARYH